MKGLLKIRANPASSPLCVALTCASGLAESHYAAETDHTSARAARTRASTDVSVTGDLASQSSSAAGRWAGPSLLEQPMSYVNSRT